MKELNRLIDELKKTKDYPLNQIEYSETTKKQFADLQSAVGAVSPTVSPLLEGVKLDQGKTQYELLPPELLHAVADILTFGAKKYSARNWELGMNWSRPFGALMRHLWAWWNPFESSTDPETGKSHLWHAACCLAFLIAYEERKVGTDDRPTKNVVR